MTRRRRAKRTLGRSFEVFREGQRRETAQKRGAALEALLGIVNRRESPADTIVAKCDLEFLLELHRLAWLHTPNTTPPNRIVAQPRVSDALVRRTHAHMRDAFLALFPIGGKKYERTEWQPPFQGEALVTLLRQHQRVHRVLAAAWPDTMWVAILSLLEEFGSKLARCPVCEAHLMFVKSKRQEYCSRQCSQRARSARWYANNRDLALDRRHKAYKRTVVGGVVARRPRHRAS